MRRLTWIVRRRQVKACCGGAGCATAATQLCLAWCVRSFVRGWRPCVCCALAFMQCRSQRGAADMLHVVGCAAFRAVHVIGGLVHMVVVVAGCARERVFVVSRVSRCFHAGNAIRVLPGVVVFCFIICCCGVICHLQHACCCSMCCH